MPVENVERRPHKGSADQEEDRDDLGASVGHDADTAAHVAVRRLTGCPRGCGPDGHESDCGLDWFIRERRAHHDALDRRWRGHVEHKAWLRHWDVA